MLGIQVQRLSHAVWDSRLREPKRFGRAFFWSASDVVAAAKCFGIRWTPPGGAVVAPPADLEQRVLATAPAGGDS